MQLPNRNITILDVGHGNCAIINDSKRNIIIDAGPRSYLLEFLTEQRIYEIDLVILSHADMDHISGLFALLGNESIKINKVRLNTDSIKTSKLWKLLLEELDNQTSGNKVDFKPSITCSCTGEFDADDIKLEIIGPSEFLAARGPGSTDKKDRNITSNSISTVIRVLKNSTPVILFTGDLDNVGLENIIDHGEKFNSPILVFPHHGGNAGSGDMKAFTKKLCDNVSPELIVFSNGRSEKSNTPLPDVVEAALEINKDVKISCTQLSKDCAEPLPEIDSTHLVKLFSKGREKRSCCAGTMVINIDSPTQITPVYEAHQDFIDKYALSAMCRIK